MEKSKASLRLMVTSAHGLHHSVYTQYLLMKDEAEAATSKGPCVCDPTSCSGVPVVLQCLLNVFSRPPRAVWLCVSSCPAVACYLRALPSPPLIVCGPRIRSACAEESERRLKAAEEFWTRSADECAAQQRASAERARVAKEVHFRLCGRGLSHCLRLRLRLDG